MADKIIIEVNTAAPSFEGLHDITMTDLPPRRKPYLIMSPEDRIGTPHIPIDPERVVAIVESDYPDQTQPNAPEDDTSRAIASNLIEFLKHEVQHGRLPDNLLPIQSGIGNIANAVVGGLAVRIPSPHCLAYTRYTNVCLVRRRQLQKPQSLDRSPPRLLPRPLRQRQPRLRNRNLDPLLSRRLRALLQGLGPVRAQTPTALAASQQFARDHPPTGRNWNEHAC
jgi:hypothetical protein